MNKIKTALISVSDKTGVLEFATALNANGIRIISTGGTAKALRDAGIKITDISDYTGFPEMLDGRLKTLHPKVHGGLLGLRDDESHTSAMQQHDIAQIDMVVVNLYPFEETVAKGADFATCIENIDIGGPAMIRSAAKNHRFVTVITSHADYNSVIQEIHDNNGSVSEGLNRILAAKAFARTAGYDAAISTWFANQLEQQFPETITVSASLRQQMRYGENPQQKAAYYTFNDAGGISGARQLQGKELSYNNINDADAAWNLVCEFTEPAAVIIKHANPCGAAIGADVFEAYSKAFACDSISAFGGIVALNKEVNEQTAKAISDIFYEVIIAPSFSAAALEILSAKKNLRLLVVNNNKPANALYEIKSVGGGLLLQEKDSYFAENNALKVVSTKQPTSSENTDMLFALKVVKHVKSNAIVIAKNGAAIGIGAGQMSRVKSVQIACEKAIPGAVLASDAFFPFPDNVEIAAKAGISAIIQPGGSVKDGEVIEAANKHGIAMTFSGLRHFKH